MTMMGVSTLTLGSTTSMVVSKNQVQYATTTSFSSTNGKVLARAQSSLPMNLMSLVPSTTKNCSLFLPFKESSHVCDRHFITNVASVDSDQISSTDPASKNEANKYYFIVANAKFMLDEEEHFQEQLFERLRHYGERNIEHDFWLVVEPKFLDKFPDITKRLRRPAVALVSTNGPWITFMKLRLDRVLTESFEAESLEEALASNPTDLEFEKPEKWVAPYPKYEFGWWKTFLPPGQKEVKS